MNNALMKKAFLVTIAVVAALWVSDLILSTAHKAGVPV